MNPAGRSNVMSRMTTTAQRSMGILSLSLGPAYFSATLAYGWQDITTERSVLGVDQLRANFNANAFSGRIEGGYRIASPWIGLTPYAAGQFTTVSLPAYTERVLGGPGLFGLDNEAKNATASRSELGLRTDKSFVLTNAVLTLRGRAVGAQFRHRPLDRSNLPGAARRILCRRRRRARKRCGTYQRRRRGELAQWLFHRRHLRGRVLECDALLRRQGSLALRMVRANFYDGSLRKRSR
jgi:hypothetical protein